MATAMDAGIYAIIHCESGRRYVGSAASFSKRWLSHICMLRKGNHHSSHLQHAWSKYGEAAFVFEKLLICAKKDLTFYEQLCIDVYNSASPESGYNINSVAGSRLGCRHTLAALAQMRITRTGRKQSRESIEKRAAKLRGRSKPPLTAEHKARLRDNKINNKLDLAKAEEIRKLCSSGVPRSSVAKLYSVSRATVWFVVNEKIWRNLYTEV